MSKTLERLQKAAEATEITSPGGIKWRIEPILAPDWGVLYGGILTFQPPETSPNGAEPSLEERTARDREQTEQNAEFRKRCYDLKVKGPVDEETGELLPKPAFETLPAEEMIFVTNWYLGRRPTNTENQDLIGRSLS